MMKVLVFDPALCAAQLGCEETCSRTWFKQVDHNKSAIRIITAEGKSAANICTQCGQCIDVCPTLALQRDKQGIVRINKNLCVGCLSCVGFCPYGAMRILPDSTTPFKCVACGACVKTCPTGALAVIDLPDAPLTATEKRLKGEA